MKRVHIKEKLRSIGIDPKDVVLGDFDRIGEFCAKKDRGPENEHYKKAGSFFRPNYERGILVYYLIRQFNLTSVLEIGFGRGYVTMCAAKAFCDLGIAGRITTIEPNIDKQFLNAISQIFPKDWFNYVQFMQGTSEASLPQLSNEKFDLVYIDGDHTYEGTKFDYEHTKDIFSKFLLFDDYHLSSKNDTGIDCARLIDQIDHNEINCNEPELFIMDRRMFFDDRKLTDDQIDYGQVLFTKKDVKLEQDEW